MCQLYNKNPRQVFDKDMITLYSKMENSYSEKKSIFKRIWTDIGKGMIIHDKEVQ